MAEGASQAPVMRLADYAAALPLLLADRPVRPPLLPGARLRILGPLEARLVSVDRMVLAGLVESHLAERGAHRPVAQPADARGAGAGGAGAAHRPFRA